MKQCFFIILNHSLFCFQFRIRINAYVFRCEIVSPVKPDFHKGTVSRLDAGIIHAILQMPRWPWVVAAGSRQEHVLSGTLGDVGGTWRCRGHLAMSGTRGDVGRTWRCRGHLAMSGALGDVGHTWRCRGHLQLSQQGGGRCYWHPVGEATSPTPKPPAKSYLACDPGLTKE